MHKVQNICSKNSEGFISQYMFEQLSSSVWKFYLHPI